jgi:glycosyltransferase involved in cell wall biosynthesis
MRASYLITFRDDGGGRAADLRLVAEWVSRLASAQLIVVEQATRSALRQGDLPSTARHILAYNGGPFNKSWGLNVAARHAQAEVLIVADADLIVPIQALSSAIAACHDGLDAVNPYARLVDVAPDVTESLRNGELDQLESLPAHDINRTAQGEQLCFCGGAYVIRRSAYERLGGQDERFVGWGGEDDAMSIKVLGLLEKTATFARPTAYHLHHARRHANIAADDHYRANIELLRAYRAMSADELRALCEAQRATMGDAGKYGGRGPARSLAIKFYSLAETSGYGLAGIAYVEGLARARVPLAWTPLTFDGQSYVPLAGPEDWERACERDPGLPALPPVDPAPAADAGIEFDTVLMHCTPEYWPSLRVPGVRNVGYVAWETNRIPPQWPELLEAADTILVPSAFSRDALLAGGVHTPVHVVPHIARRLEADRAAASRWKAAHKIPPDHVVFYTIGCWTARKAMWDTLNAYLLAFGARDRVTLVIKTDAEGVRSGNAPRREPTAALAADIVASYPDPAAVRLLGGKLSGADIDALHCASDCYVSLTRSEGWGLGAFDAACAGNPVIITGWGGQLEYLDGDGALLVDYTLEPVADVLGGASYRADQKWARADIEHAIALLQAVHHDPTAARRRAAPLAARIAGLFAEPVVIARMLEAIRVQGT